MTRNILLSAIILNYRSPQDALQCARSLLSQENIGEIEILLTNNASEDDSIGIFRATFQHEPRVRIIETARNLGFGGGNNYAAHYAQGKYLLIINPDNILPKDGLATMLKQLQEDETIGIVGPALVHPDGSLRPSARPFPDLSSLLWKRLCPQAWHANFSLSLQAQNSDAKDVDWMVGACIFLKRDLYETLGGFDSRYFLFFEDIDLCRRCWELGKRVVYMPSVRALDKKQRLSGSSIFSLLTNWTTRVHARSAMQYFWKWRGKEFPSKSPSGKQQAS